MKKIFIKVPFSEEQQKRLESISEDLEFVYKEDKSANVIIGNIAPACLKEFKNLEWIQTAAVGVDKYIKEGVLPEGVILTNAVDVHTKEVSEHTLAVILMMIKKLHLYRNDQIEHKWCDEGKVKEISKLKICIVGLGNIGKHLAKLLKGLGIYVIGVKRNIEEKPDFVDELYSNKQLKTAISDVDVVVTILPGNKANVHLFDLETFQAMRKDAILINVGRGNLFSEEVMKKVLEEKIIAGIAADVFENEPLDPKNKLWDYPNLLITPHAAGSYHLESAFEALFELVEENLRHYVNNEELKYIVKERD